MDNIDWENIVTFDQSSGDDYKGVLYPRKLENLALLETT